MQTRDRIHQLIDALPDRELPAVERFIERQGAASGVLPPILANADDDDEPTTEAEEMAVAAAHADVEAGRVVSHWVSRRPR